MDKYLYASENGYSLIFHTKKKSRLRPAVWALDFIRDLLGCNPSAGSHKFFEKRFDWVFWIDIDAMFLKYDVGVREIVERAKASALKHPSNVCYGEWPSVIAAQKGKLKFNAGVLLFRNTPFSTSLIESVRNWLAFLRFWFVGNEEQTALEHRIQKRKAHRTGDFAHLTYSFFNAIGATYNATETYIRHTAGGVHHPNKLQEFVEENFKVWLHHRGLTSKEAEAMVLEKQRLNGNANFGSLPEMFPALFGGP